MHDAGVNASQAANRTGPARLPVSAVLVTRDEADRLPRALASLAWADEIVVVDAGSRDGTAELAAQAGARVYVHAWEGFSAQKAYAVARTSHGWVLWLDADEEVSAPLRASIERALTRQAQGADCRSAYAMNRRTEYLGRFLHYGGWYPDRKVRLFRKDCAVFDGRAVHEALRVTGEIGLLAGELLHYSFRDFDHHVCKTRELARLWAEEQRCRRRGHASDLLLRPLAKVLKSYILQGGFLEGWRGLLLAGMGGYSVWLKYAYLRAEAGRRRSGEGA